MRKSLKLRDFHGFSGLQEVQCLDVYKRQDERWTERIALKDAMKLLDPRERRILSLRFYAGKTQMAVSAEVGISQAQVSRLEKGAINTSRKHL